jgi:general secretion pathway protein D
MARRFPSHTLGNIAGACFLGLVALLCSAPAHAQSAAAWNKRGQQAELREDYDAAFEGYRHAFLKKPGDLRYKERYERMRFQAAASHVDRGRVLRAGGDIPGALAEFTRAMQIDPANETAGQEIVITNRNPAVQATPVPGGPSAANPGTAGLSAGQTQEQADVLRDIASVTAPVVLQPVSTDRITLHMVEDVKVIYQAIGKAIGFNVLFDPDYTSKRIPVDLTNTSWEDALRIVGTISGTFYKPVTSNTIYVAQNTRTKRTDLDELAVQTFYLTNASQANDANEVTTALRNLLDPSTKVYLVPSQNAIVVRATTDQLLLCQKLLNDLDRAKPEVVVDVAILEVNRDKIRNLGITLPQSFGLTPQASTANSTTSSTTTSTTSTTSNFTLNTLANLNATNLAVTVSGGTVNALLSDADTRVLQNPRIRATDGQRATLKIGSKIPVATGSYSAGAATGVTAGIGVQTQFTYLDVGVNIDMTPTVHYDRDVSLKMKIEVSTQSGSVTISGVTEPIIGQRVIEQTIQLKEGEPSILAGILTKQDNRTNSGTPGLAEIPFFKYFFGSQYKELQQDEVVFLLIPHIVRESVLTRMNTRAIDTGTSQSIELRRDPTPLDALFNPAAGQPAPAVAGTTAANAASAAVQQMKQQAMPPTPTPVEQPAVPLLPAVNLSVMPPESTQPVGSTFQVAIIVSNARDLYSVPIQVQFNNKVIELVNVDSGDFLSHGGQSVALVHRDEGNGLVTISASRPPNTKGVDGQGNVCTLTFRALAPGDSTVTLSKVGAKNSTQVNIPVIGAPAVVHIK